MNGQHTRRLVPVALGLIVMTASACHAQINIERVEHRGFADAVRMKTGQTTLIVVPQWAGRASVLDFGQGNWLHQNPKVNGKTLAADQGWMPWDGNATDLVNHEGKNQWPGLWLHPWTDVAIGEQAVAMSSGTDSPAGVVAQREYIMSKDGRTVVYNHRITQNGEGTGKWTIWERMVVPKGVRVITPLRTGGNFPAGWKPRDAGKPAPEDHAKRKGNYLVMTAGVEKGVGLAAQLPDGWGWIACRRGAEAMLIQFRVDANGEYPHDGGANAVFYLAPDFVELEPLSPQYTLKQGESARFMYRWVRLDLPQDIAEGDDVKLGDWLSRRFAPRPRR